jgi:ubiquinone/menaquinone biosynthesis C-methylase UbiE
VNLFVYEAAAKRYVQSRPYFHPIVIQHIKDTLGLDRLFHRALDVGCGTGQSSVALTEIAHHVVGTDISPAMLAEAQPKDRVCYATAAAERLPFVDRAFGLVTAGLAFHWFQRQPFFAEAWRVLRPSGWLVIYNNWFTGRMIENPDFEKWSNNDYMQRYPTPPRNYDPLTAGDTARSGFALVSSHSYNNEVEFSVDELVRYLTTQTNVIAAVEQGGEDLNHAHSWLVESVRPFFSKPRCTFQFGGSIDYLQKIARHKQPPMSMQDHK